MTAITEEMVEAFSVAFDTCSEGVKPSIRAGLQAVLDKFPATPDQITCGACGKPWTGESCGQKDNGWPHPVCYPVVLGNAAPHRNAIVEECAVAVLNASATDERYAVKIRQQLAAAIRALKIAT